MKVLLSSFHLNGHTLGFHPQTELKVQHNKQYHMKILLDSLDLIAYTPGLIHRLQSQIHIVQHNRADFN